ncbi:MAG TPA: PhzF family phenazine biosynthesis protein [Solirubrobacteraceae bacterium]|nr:PhzF family phenazine biosynthesis protein [Solirubrobacteraceae bacterium]
MTALSDTARLDWLGGPPAHPYLVVDVFTPRPLEGNQLGVFLDGESFSTEDMQRLAREMNFAETIFVLAPESGGDARVRIFTPGVELPFAGHPVLGAAFVIGTASGSDAVVLETGAGPVPVELERADGRVVFGRMEQPIPTWEPFDRHAELLSALGVQSSGLPIEVYRNGPVFVYVKLSDEAEVAALEPDMARLKDLGAGASCFAGQGTSWKARLFYPAAGVPEDAATGSAAGPLALHLARHGEIPFGQEIEIRQGEEINRPSLLYATVAGSAERVESIHVGGGAQIVAHGQFRLSG